MKKKESKLKKLLKAIYDKVFTANDSWHRIAFGFGLGIFSGIFPGTGPVAAFILAVILRVNRAAALAGSLLVNTWFSFISFLLAVKIGAMILGIDWHTIYTSKDRLFEHFHFSDIIKASFIKVIYPVALGYLIVGLTAGLISYIIIFSVLALRKRIKKGLKK